MNHFGNYLSSHPMLNANSQEKELLKQLLFKKIIIIFKHLIINFKSKLTY